MPRPSKCRRICALPKTSGFAPAHAEGDAVILALDEYEAVRLIDLEGLTQEECARQMGVSRTTVTGIYDAARHKLAEALVSGRRLQIQGGNVTLCRYASGCCGRCAQDCRWDCPRPCRKKEAGEAQELPRQHS